MDLSSYPAWTPNGFKPVSKFTDKGLDNLAGYNTSESKRKNIKKNAAKLIAVSTLGPSAIAYIVGRKDPNTINLKRAGKIGLATGTLGAALAIAGHEHNKLLAKAANEEKQKRKEVSILKDLTS